MKILTSLLIPLAFVPAASPQTNSPSESLPLPPITVIGGAPELPQRDAVAASVVAGDMFDCSG